MITVTTSKPKTVRVIAWKNMPEAARWAHSTPMERNGRYILFDGNWYCVNALIYARHSASNFGIAGWDYVFCDATKSHGIVLRPTKGNVGKWPHEWTHVEVMPYQG